MTEDGWTVCVNPFRLLGCLLSRGRASDRKLLLFAAACSRRISDTFLSEMERDAVEVAERYAEGGATWEELGRIAFPASGRGRWDSDPLINFVQASAVVSSERLAQNAYGRVLNALDAGPEAVNRVAEELNLSSWEAKNPRDAHVKVSCRERYTQEVMVRDIFGNPFRPTPVIDPSWLSWDRGTVHNLAGAVYDERNLDRMPILADALEDAGCTETELLGHLRGPGPHVRGCWALDLILAKESLVRDRPRTSGRSREMMVVQPRAARRAGTSSGRGDSGPS